MKIQMYLCLTRLIIYSLHVLLCASKQWYCLSFAKFISMSVTTLIISINNEYEYTGTDWKTAWRVWRTKKRRTSERGGQMGHVGCSESPPELQKPHWRLHPWWSSQNTCKTHTHNNMRQAGKNDTIILFVCHQGAVITCGCQRPLLTLHTRSSSSSGHLWLCWWVGPSTGEDNSSQNHHSWDLRKLLYTATAWINTHTQLKLHGWRSYLISTYQHTPTDRRCFKL